MLKVIKNGQTCFPLSKRPSPFGACGGLAEEKTDVASVPGGDKSRRSWEDSHPILLFLIVIVKLLSNSKAELF